MEPRITTLLIVGAVILLFYIVTLGFIGSDLWAGIRKAKQRGEMRTSEALKRTVEKINKYFNMLFALTLVDVVQISLIFFLYWFYKYDIWMIPVFTLGGTFYIAYIEITSIMEPADIKEKKQQDDFKRLLMQLAENKDLREKIVDILKVKEKEESDE